MEDSQQRLLTEFLGINPETTCPGCGYRLRGLTGNRCPECGDEFSLRVGLVEPKQAACIAGLIALAGGAGFNALLLVYGLVRGTAPNYVYVILCCGLVVEGSATSFWLKRWHTIRRSSSRGALAIGCYLLAAVDLWVFCTTVR